MPRRARAVLPGYALHIVQRGINRNPCFLAEGDFLAYLRFLCQFSSQFSCSVHAYCLMTNHVHLLVTPAAADACARFMKGLSQCYVQWLNHRLDRSGTLWEGRFHSCLVNSDPYVLACYRYIELNPVRAGMVASAELYPWSSHTANAAGAFDAIVAPHPAYLALAGEPASRWKAYRELCSSAPPAPIIEEIRKATRVGCVAGMRRRGRGRPGACK